MKKLKEILFLSDKAFVLIFVPKSHHGFDRALLLCKCF